MQPLLQSISPLSDIHEESRNPLLRRAAIALLVTLFYYFLLMYVNFGFIILPKGLMYVELLGNYIFIFALFWVYERVSPVFNRPGSLQPVLKNVLEALVIIMITVLLALLTILLPIFLLDPDLPVPYERLRVGFAVIILISLFFYYFVERERNRKQLQKAFLRSEQLQKENFKAQLEALKNQVNPHFLFNSLNVLGALIYKDQDLAVDYVSQLSEVYRAFLENSQRQLVPLQQELRLLDAYSFLLQTRFGDSLVIEQAIPAEWSTFQIPPGALQTVVENAVKHNGFTAKKPLVVSLTGENNSIIVKNNLQPRIGEVASGGIGLGNLTARYRYLGQEEPAIKKTETEFTITLPLITKA